MPRSEKKTDVFGKEYTQHYDDDGNKSGWSEDKADIFGDKYEQRYDNDGNKTGWSEDKTDFFGDKYEQHYDNESGKAGWSEGKTDFFGDEYEQHYDNDNDKTGWSEYRKDIWGKSYEYTDGKKSGTTESASVNKDEYRKGIQHSSGSSTKPNIGGFPVVLASILMVVLALILLRSPEDVRRSAPTLTIANSGADYFNIFEYLASEYCVAETCYYLERNEHFCDSSCTFSGAEGRFIAKRIEHNDFEDALQRARDHHLLLSQQGVPRGFPRNNVSEIRDYYRAFIVVRDGCIDFLCDGLLVAIVGEEEAHIVEVALQ